LLKNLQLLFTITEQRRHGIDSILFFLAFFIAEVFALHGKAFASFIFNNGNSIFRESAHKPEIYGVLFIAVLACQAMRHFDLENRSKLLLASMIGFGAAIAVQMHDSPSVLVFFLQVFVFATVAGIIWMESFLTEEMEKEFWVLLFENVFKSIRYILVGYAALIVVLKFISSGGRESTIGFLTTLFYPTVIILFSIFAIGYWILIPCWQRIVLLYKAPYMSTNRRTCFTVLEGRSKTSIRMKRKIS